MSVRRPKTKICTRCGLRKKLGDFSPRKDGKYGRHAWCRACRRGDWNSRAAEINSARRSDYSQWDEKRRKRQRAATKRYRENNRERLLQRHREHHREMRNEVIQRYGGACACCGETRIEFLVIDHVEGGGHKERQAIGTNGVYRKLSKAEGTLKGYRVLCYNCNCALAFCGYCPHTSGPIG